MDMGIRDTGHQLTAADGLGVYLTTQPIGTPNVVYNDLSVTSRFANISFVVFGGSDNNATLDRLEFNRVRPISVPEPETSGLLAFSIAALASTLGKIVDPMGVRTQAIPWCERACAITLLG